MSKFKAGDKVRFISKNTEDSPYLPDFGTEGNIISAKSDGFYFVQWPEGSTRGDGKWFCFEGRLQLVKDKEEGVRIHITIRGPLKDKETAEQVFIRKIRKAKKRNECVWCGTPRVEPLEVPCAFCNLTNISCSSDGTKDD